MGMMEVTKAATLALGSINETIEMPARIRALNEAAMLLQVEALTLKHLQEGSIADTLDIEEDMILAFPEEPISCEITQELEYIG